MRLPVPARFRSGTDATADATADATGDAPANAPAADAPAKNRPTAAARTTTAPQRPPAGSDPRPKPAKPKSPKRPLYVRLLHLRHIAPNAWQRAVLGEGSLAVAVVLVLADLATAWTLLVLPLAVAAVVKAHDLLAWLLGRPAVPPPAPKRAKAPAPDARTAPAPEGRRRR